MPNESTNCYNNSNLLIRLVSLSVSVRIICGQKATRLSLENCYLGQYTQRQGQNEEKVDSVRECDFMIGVVCVEATSVCGRGTLE